MSRQPMFNVPGVVLAIVAVLIAVHVGLQQLSPQNERWWLLALAFIPARFAPSAPMLPGYGWAEVTSWLSHALVHGDALHLGINIAFLLAFGAACVRRIGTARFLALLLLSTIAGAATYLAINGPANVVMVGASGGISGLLGAVLRFLFPATSIKGAALADVAPLVPRLSLRGMWRVTPARLAVLSWLALNLIMAVVLPASGMTAGIAWEAHLGGFAVGLLGFGYFDTVHGEIDDIPRHLGSLDTEPGDDDS